MNGIESIQTSGLFMMRVYSQKHQ